jgi:hypothetical protein
MNPPARFLLNSLVKQGSRSYFVWFPKQAKTLRKIILHTVKVIFMNHNWVLCGGFFAHYYGLTRAFLFVFLATSLTPTAGALQIRIHSVAWEEVLHSIVAEII